MDFSVTSTAHGRSPQVDQTLSLRHIPKLFSYVNTFPWTKGQEGADSATQCSLHKGPDEQEVTVKEEARTTRSASVSRLSHVMLYNVLFCCAIKLTVCGMLSEFSAAGWKLLADFRKHTADI